MESSLRFEYGKLSAPPIDDNLLYYYCSMDTFFKIVDSKKIWLRNLLEMNDPSELALHKINIPDVIYKQYSENKFKFEYANKQNEEAMKTLLLPDAFMYSMGINPIYNNLFFAFCMTNREDALTQWTTYGDDGRGVCLGFKKVSLQNFQLESENFSLQKVQYYRDYNELASTLSKMLLDKIRELSGNDSELKEFAGNLTNNTVPEWTKYKIKDYSNEEETRLVYHKESNQIISNIGADEIDTKYLSDLKFAMRGNKLDIHIEVDVSKLGLATITLGPANDNKIDAIKMYLAQKGFKVERADFHRSSIPYRG